MKWSWTYANSSVVMSRSEGFLYLLDLDRFYVVYFLSLLNQYYYIHMRLNLLYYNQYYHPMKTKGDRAGYLMSHWLLQLYNFPVRAQENMLSLQGTPLGCSSRMPGNLQCFQVFLIWIKSVDLYNLSTLKACIKLTHLQGFQLQLLRRLTIRCRDGEFTRMADLHTKHMHIDG